MGIGFAIDKIIERNLKSICQARKMLEVDCLSSVGPTMKSLNRNASLSRKVRKRPSLFFA